MSSRYDTLKKQNSEMYNKMGSAINSTVVDREQWELLIQVLKNDGELLNSVVTTLDTKTDKQTVKDLSAQVGNLSDKITTMDKSVKEKTKTSLLKMIPVLIVLQTIATLVSTIWIYHQVIS